MKIACVNCGQPYPESGVPYKCPNCGGVYDYVEPLTFGESDRSISLGEGNTPLLVARALGREVYFKCEYLNPTGSFKDRGTATLVSFLRSRGVAEAIEDSSGNAGASFAAYAARAGIKARVYVPDSASGPKRKQIEAYGAELVPVPGPRSKASEAVMQAAAAGTVYASHAYLPFNLPGYATCAYEIYQQLGRGPGAIIVPAGQGGFLLGMARGFEALLLADKIQRLPMMIGVQATACAPLHALWKNGTMDAVVESPTIAEGVRTRWPVRLEAVVEITRRSGGRFAAVDEAFILSGRDALARLGFYVEPTSALVCHALEESISDLLDPVVVVLTGSGLKYLL
jgi:threonine synthase